MRGRCLRDCHTRGQNVQVVPYVTSCPNVTANKVSNSSARGRPERVALRPMNQTSPPSVPYEFDIALSFAGEDREFVEKVAAALKAQDIRVFYDSDYSTEMWGEDLVEYLDSIYRLKARYAVIFISQSYAAKMWTSHERRSVLARALEDSDIYMLPVRLDDTKLSGLRPTIGYLDARQVGLAGIVSALIAKLNTTRPIQSSPITRVPRNEVERQRLLLDRPGPGNISIWQPKCFTNETQ